MKPDILKRNSLVSAGKAGPQNPRKHYGLSLTEILITLALGLLLMAGLLTIFASNKQTFRLQDGLARIQENGRYASHILSENIRMAGFQGCPSISSVTPTNLVQNPQPAQIFTLDTVVRGYDNVADVPAWITANLASGTAIAANTDILVIRKASQRSANLAQNMTSTSDNIILTANNLNIVPGDTLVISDCESANIFVAGNGTTSTQVTHPDSVNTSSDLSKNYHTDARVYRLENFVYYIKNTGRTNEQGQPILALYRQNLQGAEEEIIEGVENMQIFYGVDSSRSGSVDMYRTATEVSSQNHWDRIASVDIALLLTSVENANAQSQNYTYVEENYTSNDRLFRRQWDIFINLRNIS